MFKKSQKSRKKILYTLSLILPRILSAIFVSEPCEPCYQHQLQFLFSSFVASNNQRTVMIDCLFVCFFPSVAPASRGVLLDGYMVRISVMDGHDESCRTPGSPITQWKEFIKVR